MGSGDSNKENGSNGTTSTTASKTITSDVTTSATSTSTSTTTATTTNTLDLESPKPRRFSASLIDVEDETEINTKKNALLYHTSEDTVDLYRQQNNSSDLLGRLYYDDYDSDSAMISPITSATHTPLLSPILTGGSAHSVNINHIPSLDLVSSQLARSTSALSRPSLSRLQSFERSISFDTTTNNHRKSIILKVKHPQFKFRRNNKTFLAGYNNDLESLKAIEWLFDEMIVHGDTIVVLQVLDEKQFEFIDREKVNRSLERIERLNTKLKKVSLVFEVVIGKVQKLLKSAIDEYNPAMMIIGSHHYDGKEHHHRSFLSKSPLSKHFLECALVPVILVKSNYHHQENLIHPIDSKTYFEDWIKSIDISDTYLKKRSNSNNRSSTNLRRPTSSSRTSSFTNLTALIPDRGKPSEDRGRSQQLHHPHPHHTHESESSSTQQIASPTSTPTSRSSSSSRGFAKFFSHK